MLYSIEITVFGQNCSTDNLVALRRHLRVVDVQDVVACTLVWNSSLEYGRFCFFVHQSVEVMGLFFEVECRSSSSVRMTRSWSLRCSDSISKDTHSKPVSRLPSTDREQFDEQCEVRWASWWVLLFGARLAFPDTLQSKSTYSWKAGGVRDRFEFYTNWRYSKLYSEIRRTFHLFYVWARVSVDGSIFLYSFFYRN